MLRTVILGQKTTRPPLLIVPGLFGSARNWRAIAKRLSDEREVISVDMRNHGESPRAPTQSYHDMAADLAEVIATHGAKADVLGHSMGGKAAMVLALTRPELVHRLVVADIAPVAYTHTQSHLIAAMKALDPAAYDTRSAADRALAKDVHDPAVRAFLLQSLDLKNHRWRLNLVVLERELPKIMGFPDVGSPFPRPALFLAGGASDYIRPQYRPRIKALFPAARFASIPGADHWLHAEKPREFVAAVRAFLNA